MRKVYFLFYYSGLIINKKRSPQSDPPRRPLDNEAVLGQISGSKTSSDLTSGTPWGGGLQLNSPELVYNVIIDNDYIGQSSAITVLSTQRWNPLDLH